MDQGRLESAFPGVPGSLEDSSFGACQGIGIGMWPIPSANITARGLLRVLIPRLDGWEDQDGLVCPTFPASRVGGWMAAGWKHLEELPGTTGQDAGEIPGAAMRWKVQQRADRRWPRKRIRQG